MKTKKKKKVNLIIRDIKQGKVNNQFSVPPYVATSQELIKG